MCVIGYVGLNVCGTCDDACTVGGAAAHSHYGPRVIDRTRRGRTGEEKEQPVAPLVAYLREQRRLRQQQRQQAAGAGGRGAKGAKALLKVAGKGGAKGKVRVCV